MSIINIITVSAISLVLLASCTGRHHLRGEMNLERLEKVVSSELKLKNDQKQKLRLLLAEFEIARTTLQQDRDLNRAKIHELFQSATLDQTKVLQLIDQMKEDIDKVAPKVVAKLASLHDTLDPSQRQELHKLMQKQRNRGHR